MARKTSDAGAKAGPGDLRRGDPGSYSSDGNGSQGQRLCREVAIGELMPPILARICAGLGGRT